MLMSMERSQSEKHDRRNGRRWEGVQNTNKQTNNVMGGRRPACMCDVCLLRLFRNAGMVALQRWRTVRSVDAHLEK